VTDSDAADRATVDPSVVRTPTGDVFVTARATGGWLVERSLSSDGAAF
jgi:hypothetical protein